MTLLAELLLKVLYILTHLAGWDGVCENKMVSDLESVGCSGFMGLGVSVGKEKGKGIS
jgi:hypothetical protein